MKRILFASLAYCCLTSSLLAQEFKPFRLGLGIGYAQTTGSGAAGGALITIEPQYRLNDQLAIGVRMESAAVARGYSLSLAPGTEIGVAAIGSFAATGQYYFSNNDFRPFAGAGMGMFTLTSFQVTSTSVPLPLVVPTETRFGFFPRLGFDYNHFTLAVEFNIIPPTAVVGAAGEVNNSYLGVRLGGFISGGRR